MGGLRLAHHRDLRLPFGRRRQRWIVPRHRARHDGRRFRSPRARRSTELRRWHLRLRWRLPRKPRRTDDESGRHLFFRWAAHGALRLRGRLGNPLQPGARPRRRRDRGGQHERSWCPGVERIAVRSGRPQLGHRHPPVIHSRHRARVFQGVAGDVPRHPLQRMRPCEPESSDVRVRRRRRRNPGSQRRSFVGRVRRDQGRGGRRTHLPQLRSRHGQRHLRRR